MGLVSLDDFREVLQEATKGENRYVLVGGLAVALWAERFSIMPDKWPLYSKDLDLRGLRPVAQAIGLLLMARGFRVPVMTTIQRKQPPGMGRTHVIQVDLPSSGLTNIEVMERLPLLDGPDGFPQGEVIAVGGIQVLDPISLLICKAHAWNHRSKDEPSNDAIHIEMLAGILPKFITEAGSRGLDIRDRLTALRKAIEICPLPLTDAFWNQPIFPSL